MSKWKKPDQPSNGEPAESVEPERKPWWKAAMTPEDRAKEGVQASTPESSLMEASETRLWSEACGASSAGVSYAAATQVEPAPTQAWQAGPASYESFVGQSHDYREDQVSQPFVSSYSEVVSERQSEPASVSQPAHERLQEGSVPLAASPAYDYFAHTAHDPYAYNQYDDYYLIDDYYLQDDYYYQDDYYHQDVYYPQSTYTYQDSHHDPQYYGSAHGDYGRAHGASGSSSETYLNPVQASRFPEISAAAVAVAASNATFQPVEASHPTFVPSEVTYGITNPEPYAGTNRENYASSFLRDEHYKENSARVSVETLSPSTHIEAGAAVSLTSNRGAENHLNTAVPETRAIFSAPSVISAQQILPEYPVSEGASYTRTSLVNTPIEHMPTSESPLTRTDSFAESTLIERVSDNRASFMGVESPTQSMPLASVFTVEQVAQAQANVQSHESVLLQDSPSYLAQSQLKEESPANRLTVNRFSDEPSFLAENPLTVYPDIPVQEEIHQTQIAAESLFSVPTQEQVSTTSSVQTSILKNSDASFINMANENGAEPLLVRMETLLPNSRWKQIQPEPSSIQATALPSALLSSPISEGAAQALEHSAQASEKGSVESLLVDPDYRIRQAEGFIFEPEAQAKHANTDAISLLEETGAAASVLLHSPTESHQEPVNHTFHSTHSIHLENPSEPSPHATGVLLSNESDHSLTPNPKPHHEKGSASSLLEEGSANSLLVDTGDKHSEAARIATVAGAGALGALHIAGHAAGKALKGAVGAAGTLANQAMREDEDLARVATAQDMLIEATDKARHARSTDIHLEVIRDARHAEGELLEKSAHAEGELQGEGLLREKGAHAVLAEKETKGVHASHTKKDAVDSAKHAKAEMAEEALTPSHGKHALNKHALAEKELPVAAFGKHAKTALCAEKDNGTETLLLEKGESKVKDAKHRRPVTKRERELAEKAKTAKKLREGKDPKGVSMSVVKSGANIGKKGAVFVGSLGMSSVKKAVSSENEDIASLMTMTGKTKQAIRGIQRLAGVPMKVYHAARRVIQGIALAEKTVAATVGTMGAPVLIPLLIVFVLMAGLLLLIMGTASIINEEQEVADISALVAELDEDLTEEIRQAGNQPILYAKANDTYLEKGENGKKLTIDADMDDGDYDLEEVVASTVTVQTNPAEIAAYIDAKFSGKWQVKAASWKYTVDAFGKTWTVFEWDQVPEWVRKALNRLDRSQFVYKVSAGLSIPMNVELGVDANVALDIATDIASEMAVIVYENQMQEANEEVITQVIEAAFKEHESDLDLSADDKKKLYYFMLDVITEVAGEEEPVALVYDEIVDLHAKMNYWSEDYESLLTGGSSGAQISAGSGSGSDNKYGYPNTSGYNAEELAKWDGYNEISVYGISEAGTTGTLGDGTKITNTWSDTNMAIACEGLQMEIFAYWTKAYKEATGISDSVPVKITLYNPANGKSVTAEVRDVGGWRGYNSRYAGLNQDRQWDVLPAVWKALGGGEAAGCMNVYWRVDPDAVVGGGMAEPVDIKNYPWPSETDGGDGVLTVNRATYISHGIHDVLRNEPLMDELINEESYASKSEADAVRNMVTTKVQTVMKTILSMTNINEDAYVDYTYLRRNLGDPFGEDKDGNPVQWIIAERYNPGFDDFEHDDAYVTIKPLTKTKTVYAISKGTVESVKDGKVTVMINLDTTTNDKVEYYNLKDIKVDEGDEIKTGTKLGTMADDVLHIKHYETDKSQLIMELDRDWAYDPGLCMQGFAGYAEPDAPTAYTGGGGGSFAGCSTVVEYAHSRLGCPYVWGATGPNTFDCSGLTQWCYAKAGITIPRTSQAQHDAAAASGNAHPVSDGGMQPGDILWKPGHVGIYIGNNQYIHAPQTGDVVKVSTGVLGMWEKYLTLGN